MNRFYFAYGSNMNPERIRERIPTARMIGPAFILGWRLKERLYADIERSAGGRVDGVLYLLTQIEVFRLDAFEGYPHTYGCVGLDAIIDPEHKVPAFTYVLTDAMKRKREGKKYPEDYRLICSAGARWHGIRDAFHRKGDPLFAYNPERGIWIPPSHGGVTWPDVAASGAKRGVGAAKNAAKKPSMKPPIKPSKNN